MPAERIKAKQEHKIALANQIKEVLEKLQEVTGNEEYAYDTEIERKYPHMDPSSINNHLTRLGYKGILIGHGARAIPLTAGQEVLNSSTDVIQRQMAHAIGDRVRQVYDRAQFMKERKKFMITQCNALVEQGLVA